MNAIVNLDTKLDKMGAFFDVYEEPIKTESGLIIPGKKAISRKDDKTPLAVVGDTYKTVTNEEVFTTFDQILLNSSIDTEGAETKVEFSHNGARTFVQYIFPAHQIQIGQKDDASALRIIARNSYDGTCKFSVQAGAYRFVCSNGQIFGDNISYFAGKHIASLDVEQAADKIAAVLNSFETSQAWFQELMEKKVTHNDAYACLAFASRNREAIRIGYVAEREEMPMGMRTLWDMWLLNESQLGMNAWALYNAMTEYATHHGSDAAKAKSNFAASKFRREDRVRETLQDDIWLKIAA